LEIVGFVKSVALLYFFANFINKIELLLQPSSIDEQLKILFDFF